MSSSRLKQVTKCAFCPGAPLTGEHIWPDWAKVYFQRTGHDARIETLQTSPVKSDLILSLDSQERHGHSVTKRLRVVCRGCNNTWMSELETAAKPLLEAMLLGHRTELTTADQDAVGRWVALKMMVTDLSVPSESVFTRAERESFRANPAVPNGMKIWLFGYGGINWRSALRLESYLASTVRGADPLTIASWADVPREGLHKNTRGMTLGFGCLLVFAFFTRVADFEEVAPVDFEGSVAHLWPQRHTSIVWPPGPLINERDADFVSRRLERAWQSPRSVTIPAALA